MVQNMVERMTLLLRGWPLFLVGFLLMGCEDLITLDVQEVSPQFVIVGEINNRESRHEVTIHRTVPLSSSNAMAPVSGATVRVLDGLGRFYEYNEVEPGLYRSRLFRGQTGMEYKLEIAVEGTDFQATSNMPEIVLIDSLGTSSGNFMGEENKFVTLKFYDPPNKSNYYRYTLRVNEGAPRFMSVFDDKYNDGKFVTHELINFDMKLQPNDYVRVQRQHIDQATFLYWRSVSSSNPTASAPANPPSNISNGALGYFSAYSLLEYEMTIPQ